MSLLQEIKTLQEISNDQTVTVAKTYFKSKDKVKSGEKVIDLQTSKAVFSYEAETEGYIEYLCQEGEEVPVGMVVTRIFRDLGDIKLTEKIKSAAPASTEMEFSAPALKLMDKEGLDKTLFSGKSFVTLEDVQAILGQKSQKQPLSSLAEGHILKEISKAKRIEIASLTDVQSGHLGCVAAIFVDTVKIMPWVRQHMEVLKTSLLPLIIAETSRLLPQYPELNGFYTDGRVAFYRTVHIGLAMDMEDQGLKVVKLPEIGQKDVKAIERSVLEAADKYLDNKLTMNDISGATFTITDLSGQGIAFFAPLINTRQSAILGIAAIDEKLQRCMLSLTFDHRVTDGKRAGEFLRELKEGLEGHQAQLAGTESKVCSRCFMTLEEINNYNGMGLFKVVDCNGQDKYLCEICILGW